MALEGHRWVAAEPRRNGFDLWGYQDDTPETVYLGSGANEEQLEKPKKSTVSRRTSHRIILESLSAWVLEFRKSEVSCLPGPKGRFGGCGASHQTPSARSPDSYGICDSIRPRDLDLESATFARSIARLLIACTGSDEIFKFLRINPSEIEERTVKRAVVVVGSRSVGQISPTFV